MFERDFTAQVAFHRIVVVDVLTQLRNLVLGQILDTGVGVDARGRQNCWMRWFWPMP